MSTPPPPVTCRVGQQGHPCGQPTVGMIAVETYPTVWDQDAVPVAGVVFVCSAHWFGDPR